MTELENIRRLLHEIRNLEDTVTLCQVRIAERWQSIGECMERAMPGGRDVVVEEPPPNHVPIPVGVSIPEMLQEEVRAMNGDTLRGHDICVRAAKRHNADLSRIKANSSRILGEFVRRGQLTRNGRRFTAVHS